MLFFSVAGVLWGPKVFSSRLYSESRAHGHESLCPTPRKRLFLDTCFGSLSVRARATSRRVRLCGQCEDRTGAWVLDVETRQIDAVTLIHEGAFIGKVSVTDPTS
ncbi:hypothetical protein EVAR_28768_1 [Eumeta japonica]|uniref:Uncharacterized protein n=1 Tax=Eumeta variegata TaxID=151549 RepID=A0A4C1VGU3_EUMVA|nr:hypothetical protein EVAR_28768_1 [Eumeta japonica]